MLCQNGSIAIKDVTFSEFGVERANRSHHGSRVAKFGFGRVSEGLSFEFVASQRHELDVTAVRP